ncbi:hypothetical protein GCM10011371_01190 [Novosphingobium marinum]|uniref:Uncharacterized protein n=1 Tax=Novosphingobium marinum TaxID=1514948 RepID=A0A7Y9XUV2_9SPHN|nr:hypothetical protein [Novosphingobium marinum]NYH93810.1 hypothetical protein [Novosphingobium marinum]GGC17465.1 hypothetical protein GCM10011371_01190 [Novosphingobium marinum]
MSISAFVLAPLMVLMPMAGAGEKPEQHAGVLAKANSAPADIARVAPESWSRFDLFYGVRPRAANQVRMERRVTIRISPRPSPVRPSMLMALPNREIGPRFVERKIGKCLSVSSIAGVQPRGQSRLLLFMEDQRMISAELDKTCTSRDFYSGFYLSRSDDGMLCAGRDTLLSRSGANCKLTRIRQLIEADS